jgi:phosphatidylinositol glycan class B
VFDRVWAWRRGVLANIIGWSAVAAMLFVAVYPFGLRPHMMMAKYLYRHFPAGLSAYSLTTERFKSYPMVRPQPYRVSVLFGRDDLHAALAQGPVYLFSDTPTLPVALPQGVSARLLYSEFIFARSAAAQATTIMCRYADLPRHLPVHPPRLAFWTLFRLERGGSNDAVASLCIPDWDGRKR